MSVCSTVFAIGQMREIFMVGKLLGLKTRAET
jgi:hypothetical protein